MQSEQPVWVLQARLVETLVPQSLPAAMNRRYPSRCISSAHARAIRCTPQPGVEGLPLKPYPGSDGTTRWKSSPFEEPASRSIACSNSKNDPGHPWVRMSGAASGVAEGRWK